VRIREAERAFLERLRAHHYSDALQSQARLTLGRLTSHLREKGVHDLRAVRERDLVRFLVVLSRRRNRAGERLSLASLNVYTNVLRRFFGFLEASGAILQSPAAELPLHRIEALPRGVLSQRQAQRLMEAPDETSALGLRDRALLELLYGTAIRLSEAHRLDLQDLELAGGLLLVRAGKGRKDRMVPVPREAAAALSRYLQDARAALVRDPQEQALFLTRRGRRLGRVAIGLLVRNYGIAAGVRVSPHGLRHACATHLLAGGADVRHVQQLLGHQDLRTTALYTRVEISDLREVLARAHPRERESDRL
jgi:integrase/recombinase XerD